MFTLQTFKNEAQHRGHVFDNSENASKVWARSWGLGQWWKDLWFYRQYTVGNLVYRTGKVRLRHTGYQVTQCFIGDEQVSEYKFKKHLLTFEAPALTADEQHYIQEREAQLRALLLRQKSNASHRRAVARRQDDSRHLCIQFPAA